MNHKKELWKSLFNVQKKLKLSDKDMLLILRVKEPEFVYWKYSKEVPLDTDNAYALISVHKTLCKMFKTSKEQVEWLNSVHPKFGLTPLDFVKTSDTNLLNLQMYLSLIS